MKLELEDGGGVERDRFSGKKVNFLALERHARKFELHDLVLLPESRFELQKVESDFELPH